MFDPIDSLDEYNPARPACFPTGLPADDYPVDAQEAPAVLSEPCWSTEVSVFGRTYRAAVCPPRGPKVRLPGRFRDYDTAQAAASRACREIREAAEASDAALADTLRRSIEREQAKRDGPRPAGAVPPETCVISPASCSAGGTTWSCPAPSRTTAPCATRMAGSWPSRGW